MENVGDILRRPANPTKSGRRLAAHLGEKDEFAFGAMTLGDLIYDRVSIDPSALEAFEFVKPSTSDIYKLATWSHNVIDSPIPVFQGELSRLQGYVFERMAAMSLRQSGAVVEFPMTTTNPGWDFLVNGEPVQAKCGLSSHLVTEHLSRHPNIPRIVVNEELASHFPANEYVMAVHGVTRDAVRSTTEHSLESAANMLDLHLGDIVPAISVARNAYHLWRGNTDWRALPGNLSVDVAGRFIGATAGHAIGGAVLALGLGGWPAILLPVFAATGGYRSGRALSDLIKRRILLRSEYASLTQAIMDWCAAAAGVLDTMISRADKVAARMGGYRERAAPEYVELFDDWQERLTAEQGFRRLHFHRFRRGSTDPRTFDDGSGPLGASAAAMFAASSAGLLPADLCLQGKVLKASVALYAVSLRRRLLSS
ncbi:MAG: hypothetical protein QOJ54_2140 [Aliidongia sp.]|jgi:hypothetical protein|nr:hypothetical protein [Aliidongia sp.]